MRLIRVLILASGVYSVSGAFAGAPADERITFARVKDLPLPTFDKNKPLLADDGASLLTYSNPENPTVCSEMWYGFLEGTLGSKDLAHHVEVSKHRHCEASKSTSLLKYYTIESEVDAGTLRCIFSEKAEYTDADPVRQFAATRQGTKIKDDLSVLAIRQRHCYMMLRTFVSVQNALLSALGDDADAFTTSELEAAGNMRHNLLSNDRVLVSAASDKVAPTVRIVATRLTFRECSDEFRNFYPETADPVAVVAVLNDMNYQRCEGPNDRVFDYNGKYRIETKVARIPGGKQELRCTFHDLHAGAGDQTFFSSRRGVRMNVGRMLVGYVQRRLGAGDERSQRGFFFDRIQLGKNRDRGAELQECLVLLDSFVQIQNALIERSRAGYPKMATLDSFSKGAAAKQAEQAAEAEAQKGLGAGSIALIVAGVLAALGGGYYVFTQMRSGEPKDQRRRQRRHRDGRDSV